MSPNNLPKAALLAVIFVVAALAGWELYLRNKGVKIDYDDGGPLWANKRSMVYEPKDKSTVFIGSSRIKFDLDVPTWEKITGDHAIMLAIEGSSPVPLLHDLANDKNFKGKLIVDVTEPLFFNNAPFVLYKPGADLKYYKDRTPAQRVSFELNHFLESNFVFLDKDNFSLNAELEKLAKTDRPGVYVFPPRPGFPMDFSRTRFDRTSKMTDKFVADTNLQNQVKAVWGFLRNAGQNFPPPTQGSIDTIFMEVKNSVDKINARGGSVVFIRTPSSGPMGMGEKMGFPRDKFWDRLLKETNTQGIHFTDYPAINHFECPEWSHLKPSDGVLFTRELIRVLDEEKGWEFAKTDYHFFKD